MSRVEVHHGAASDVGPVREVNEDAFLAAPPVFVVADGMGGHQGGDVASGIVAEEFGRLAATGYDAGQGAEAVAVTLRACSDRIAEYAATQQAQGIGPRSRAGTTVVAAVLVEDGEGPQWLVANLGDSRAYRFADGVLHQVSVDHSLVQELVDAGEITTAQAATHPERHVITRALGVSSSAEADYFQLSLPSAERLVLCSDGISGPLDEAAMAAIVAEVPDPRDAADRLVAAALAAGGEDNATAVVVDVVGLVADRGYDAERQRASLEQKLGVRP